MPTCSSTPRRASRWACGWRRGLPSLSSSSRAGTRRNSWMRSRIMPSIVETSKFATCPVTRLLLPSGPSPIPCRLLGLLDGGTKILDERQSRLDIVNDILKTFDDRSAKVVVGARRGGDKLRAAEDPLAQLSEQ